MTGLARRFVPGQPGGMHTLTGLAHDSLSHVAYDPEINELEHPCPQPEARGAAEDVDAADRVRGPEAAISW